MRGAGRVREDPDSGRHVRHGAADPFDHGAALGNDRHATVFVVSGPLPGRRLSCQDGSRHLSPRAVASSRFARGVTPPHAAGIRGADERTRHLRDTDRGQVASEPAGRIVATTAGFAARI